jgi:hypothetical protein
MLLQALRYYDWIYSNRDRIKEMFKGKNIDADKEPKIILIARDFSETLVKSAKYITLESTCMVTNTLRARKPGREACG